MNFKKGDRVQITVDAEVIAVGGINGELAKIKIRFGDPAGESIYIYKTVNVDLLEKEG